MRHMLAVPCIALATFLVAIPASGQTNVRPVVDEVLDQRLGEADGGPGGYIRATGGLAIRVNLEGDHLDKVVAARIILKEARDDEGNLLAIDDRVADFRTRDTNAGTLDIQLPNPARTASSVSLTGTVELFIPSRDPANTVVKVPKALAKLDTPLTSKELKAAKLQFTPLSKERYAAERSKHSFDNEEELAQIRAEGKKAGATDEEIEAVIQLAQAVHGLGETDPDEEVVVLAGKPADFEKVLSIRLLQADGEEILVPFTSSSTVADLKTMVFRLSEPPPSNAAVELTLLTKKAMVSVPFTLNDIPLP